MGSVFLERLPRWLTGCALALASAIAGLVTNSIVIAAIWLFFLIADWFLLAGLHKTRRSFGPIIPSLFALAVVRVGCAALISLSGFWPSLALMALLTLIVFYSTWIEPFDIRVTEKELIFPHWPANAPPVKLLHTGDLHLEKQGFFSERLDRVLSKLTPDLICFSGDFLNLSYNRDPNSIQDVRTVIGRWKAPYSVYATSGSPLVDIPESVSAILENLPTIHWLRDQALELNIHGLPLTLVGLTCTHNPTADGDTLVKTLQKTGNEGPVVLIYHTPDLAPESAQAGVDLQLSGHTHGGQIRAPIIGALVTSSIYRKRYEMGLYHLPRENQNPMTLYVIRGLGMEGGVAPRARFLCPPEVVLWTLKGGSPNQPEA